MIGRILRASLTTVALVVLAGAVTFLYLGWRVNRTGMRDEAQQADAIVILGAQVTPEGQPGPDLLVRTLHAVQLWQKGLAPHIICTGGYRGDLLSAAAVARKLAIAEGVPADMVVVADGSMTTREDAATARNLMLARGWKTAILVSHPLHLERARLLFATEGITAYCSPTNTNLAAIPWNTRAYLTVREVVGIAWITLEDLGLPDDWTAPLSHLVYDRPAAPQAIPPAD